MDARNVRILAPYSDGCKENTVYIDDLARNSLHIKWGEECIVVGRRRVKAQIQPLKEEDCFGQVTRMTEAMRDAVYCEVGDEVLLYNVE